jgi:hypothetical protein
MPAHVIAPIDATTLDHHGNDTEDDQTDAARRAGAA